MPAPLFASKTTEELRQERDAVRSKMQPNTVENLRRLRDAGSISFLEERLLDQFESLSWLIGDNDL